MSALATPLEEMVVSPVLYLKGEEMPSHATADADSAARSGRSTTTNSVNLNPTNATTKAG